MKYMGVELNPEEGEDNHDYGDLLKEEGVEPPDDEDA